MIKINEEIPDMKLDVFHDNDIKKVRLSDYVGKWMVILFYPRDFTFICPTELEEAAGLYETFKELGAEVLSVSTDTAFVHKAWYDSSPSIAKIKFPMIADPSGEMCKAFGTYIDEEGVSLRGTFIINPEGKVIFSEMHNNDIGRNSNETLRKLQAAIHVSQSDGEVCPASWTPGKNTLKPGVDLVGKI